MLIYFTDEIKNLTWSYEYSPQDEIQVDRAWYREDSLLVQLSETDPFVGRTTWSDLETLHYQILLLKCFDHLQDDHPDDSFTLNHKEPFMSFRFLSSALIKQTRISGTAGFELLSIMRKANGRLSVDFSKSFSFGYPDTAIVTPDVSARPNPFRIVVDNSK